MTTAILLSISGGSVSAGAVRTDNLSTDSDGHLANPVHNCTWGSGTQDYGTDKTYWSYVYFGSYPQTEISGDDLTSAITGANYDAAGDALVDGTKYRRISKNDTNNDEYFGDESTYRYFKWERIKWRVLQNDGDTLFVVADNGIDCKNNSETYDVTWENRSLGQWLNNDFYSAAFNDNEKNAIVEQTVKEGYDRFFRAKIYLLSSEESSNPLYGFCNGWSSSLWMKASDYAHIMGARTEIYALTGGNYNCKWWLRSLDYSFSRPGGRFVDTNGGGGSIGEHDISNYYAVVPALHIKLSSKAFFTEEKILLNKTAQILEPEHTLQLTATVKSSDAGNMEIQWSSSDPKVASVNNTGLVTAKKAGMATVTAQTMDGNILNANCKIIVKIRQRRV